MQVFLLLLSRVVRAHLAVLFCCRPRDSLEYKFRCTVCQPPYYLPHVASSYQTPPSGEYEAALNQLLVALGEASAADFPPPDAGP